MGTMVVYDDRIRDRLAHLGREPHHAYLFEGVRGTGKREAAVWFTAYLECEAPLETRPCRTCESCRRVAASSHPEVFHLEDDGSSIKIEEIRSLVHNLSLSRVSGTYRIALIEEARRLTREAEAALLKTLEEPARGVVIILTDSTGALTGTITSRCQRIRFSRLGSEQMREAFPALSAEALGLAAGRPRLADRFLTPEELAQYREERGQFASLARAPLDERFKTAEELAKRGELASILGEWLLSLHQELREPGIVPERAVELQSQVEALEEAREEIRHGLHPRLALEALFLSFEE